MCAGNEKAQYIGHTDLPLTTNSINDLKQIKNETPYPDVTAVISSPLKRCLDSAKIMFPKNNPIVINEFMEYDFGDFEGHTPKELGSKDEYQKWLSGDMNARVPNGESNAEFAYRVCTAFEKTIDSVIRTKTPTTAMVGSAGVLSLILSCYGLPEAGQAQWQMDPGYGFCLQIDPSLWMRSCKIIVRDTAPVSTRNEQVEDYGDYGDLDGDYSDYGDFGDDSKYADENDYSYGDFGDEDYMADESEDAGGNDDTWQ